MTRPVSLLSLAAGVAALVLLSPVSLAQMSGHGGPVRALAVSPDGGRALSGSFDQSAMLWSIEDGTALAVLRFHDGAVNAVAVLPNGRFLTGGEDGRIALWSEGDSTPAQVFAEHAGPIAGLAVSPDGRLVASASWDGTARVRGVDGSGARALEGHAGNVNAAAFTDDGRVVTAGYDGALRVWPPEAGGAPLVVQLPTPLNAVAVAPDGEMAAAGGDGVVRLVRRDGSVRSEIALTTGPVIGLALSPGGERIAAATIGGAVAVLDRARASILFHLVGPGLPVWSLAFRPDGREILTGGGDRLVRRWDARRGEPIGPLAVTRPLDPLAPFKGSRGAELFQACAACHTLTSDGGNRAGPTLHGVIGRRIASAPGYNYSEAFRRMDIVWSEETIGRLFEVGPSRYTPGSKMPEQTVPDEADRAALVKFIAEAGRER